MNIDSCDTDASTYISASYCATQSAVRPRGEKQYSDRAIKKMFAACPEVAALARDHRANMLDKCANWSLALQDKNGDMLKARQEAARRMLNET